MTKKVRLAVQMSGTRDGVAWPPVGSVVELPDDEADSMIQSGTGRAVDKGDEFESPVQVPDDVEEATDKLIPETARHEPAVGVQNLPDEDRRPNLDVIALTDDGEIAHGPVPAEEVSADDSVNMEEAAKTGLTTETGPVRRVSRSRTTSTPKTETKSGDK
jgi:hypothetical protein